MMSIVLRAERVVAERVLPKGCCPFCCRKDAVVLFQQARNDNFPMKDERI
jgi:hypothetical protein